MYPEDLVTRTIDPLEDWDYNFPPEFYFQFSLTTQGGCAAQQWVDDDGYEYLSYTLRHNCKRAYESGAAQFMNCLGKLKLNTPFTNLTNFGNLIITPHADPTGIWDAYVRLEYDMPSGQNNVKFQHMDWECPCIGGNWCNTGCNVIYFNCSLIMGNDTEYVPVEFHALFTL
jgi:hypothetical protein